MPQSIKLSTDQMRLMSLFQNVTKATARDCVEDETQDKIIFGHWATLQLHRPVAPELGLVHLDSGCLWGRELSAFRLDDEQMFSVSCNGC